MEFSLVMQNFYRGSQALIAFFAENFLWNGGKDPPCQNFRRNTEKENCRGEHGDNGSRQHSGRNDIDTSCRRDHRLVNENRLQHNQVVVKRDEAAEKRDYYEPE